MLFKKMLCIPARLKTECQKKKVAFQKDQRFNRKTVISKAADLVHSKFCLKQLAHTK